MRKVKPFSSIPRIPWHSFLLDTSAAGRFSNDQPDKLRIHRQKKHGSIYRLPLPTPIIEIFKPEDVGILLQADGKWPIRPVLPTLDLAVKRGHLHPSISHLNGAQWAELRSKMQRIFLKTNAASQFLAQQTQVALEFTDALAHVQSGRIDDFRKWSCLYAGESVGRLMIGADLHSFDESKSQQTDGMRLCRAMDELFTSTAAGVYDVPWSGLMESTLYKNWLVKQTASHKLVRELISRFDSTSLVGKGGTTSNETFLAQLLAKEELSEEEAVSFAEELFIAGVESTGNTLAFLIYHLAKNPRCQQKLYNELIKQLQHGEITSTNINTLKYLKACMKESMRLSPPVIGTTRKTSKEIVLSGHTVPPGSIVNTCGDVMCQMPEYFPAPKHFIPERWLRESLEKQEVKKFSYLPFGHGPRMCIGRRFAEQELLVATAMIVKKFQVDLINKDAELDRDWKIFYTPNQLVGIRLSLRGQ